MANVNAERRNPVTLVVKVTNPAASDLIVDADYDWTVAELKDRISTLLLSRPAVKQQKIVYYGKLLEDRQKLAAVLKQNTFGGSHTVHLVVASSPGNASMADEPAQPPGPSSGHDQLPSNDARSAVTRAYAFNMMQSQPFTTIGHASSVPPAFLSAAAGGNTYMTPQQYLWMELYARQVQYLQMLTQQQQNGRATVMQQSAFVTSTVADAPGADVPQDEAAAQAPRPAVAGMAADRDRDVVRMNAQGGDDDAEMGENQDVLDWLFMCMRGLLLFSMLYFYSSLGRLVLVFAVGAALWMFRGGAPRRDGAVHRPAAQAREPRQPDVDPQQQQQQQQPPAAGQTEPAGGSTVPPAVNPSTAGRSVFAVAASVVGNFFATLIPHHPPAGNLN